MTLHEAAITMPALYAHPFSSYSQKVFMAFYEKGVSFELRVLSQDNPAEVKEHQASWPIGRFPVLQTGERIIVESTIIIEWLDRQHPIHPKLIPADRDAALEARMLDRIFDNYVMTPMMTIVFDRLRPEGARDPYGVARARELLDRAYGWLDMRMARRTWAAAETLTLADCAAAPALFYADWVHPFNEHAALMAYFRRLQARPSFARCIDDARPSRHLFPGGAPDRDW